MSERERGELRVLGFAGSLRRGSFNRALLRAAVEVVPEGMRLDTFALDDIPLYNGDVEEQGFPPPVQRLREAIAAADALLIATPEYQYSIPGVLKNAIDWVSRPAGKAPIVGKPVAIMGATPGLWGTVRAQTHLRQALAYNDCPMVQKPEVTVANAGERFDDELKLTHEATRGFLKQLLESLARLTRLHQG